MARESYMHPNEVRRAIDQLFGRYGEGKQRRFAEAIGKHEVTVSRMACGVTPVGRTEAILIRLLLDRRREGAVIDLNELD